MRDGFVFFSYFCEILPAQILRVDVARLAGEHPPIKGHGLGETPFFMEREGLRERGAAAAHPGADGSPGYRSTRSPSASFSGASHGS